MSKYTILAKTSPGLERVLATEIQNLLLPTKSGNLLHPRQAEQFANPTGAGIVKATGVSPEGLWQLVHRCRVADQLKLRVGDRIKGKTFKPIAQAVSKVSWRNYFPINSIPPVKVRTSNSEFLFHQSALQDRIGNLVLRRLQGAPAKIPDSIPADATWVQSNRFLTQTQKEKQSLANELFPNLSQVYVSIDGSREETQLYVDLLGGSRAFQTLDNRGYRTEATEQSMKEHRAAACVQASLIPSDRVLWDPFCGTGALPLEHVAHALGWPSFRGPKAYRDQSPSSASSAAEGERGQEGQEGQEGQGVQAMTLLPEQAQLMARPHFAFQDWRIFQNMTERYRGFVADLLAGELDEMQPVLAVGSDINVKRVVSAQNNSERSGLGSAVQFVTGDFEEVAEALPAGDGDRKYAILTNMPYGWSWQNAEDKLKGKGAHKDKQNAPDGKFTSTTKKGGIIGKEGGKEGYKGDRDHAANEAELERKRLYGESKKAEYEKSTVKLYRRFGKMLRARTEFDPVLVATAHPNFPRETNLNWDTVLSFSNNGIRVNLYKLIR